VDARAQEERRSGHTLRFWAAKCVEKSLGAPVIGKMQQRFCSEIMDAQ
jgi:hypothetical protein